MAPQIHWHPLHALPRPPEPDLLGLFQWLLECTPGLQPSTTWEPAESETLGTGLSLVLGSRPGVSDTDSSLRPMAYPTAVLSFGFTVGLSQWAALAGHQMEGR